MLGILLALGVGSSAQSDVGDQEYRSGPRVDGVYGEEWQQAEANGWFRALDVTGAELVDETETTLTFLLAAADPFKTQAPPSEPNLDFSALNLHFSFDGRSYLVQWLHNAGPDQPTAVLYSTFGEIPKDGVADRHNASFLAEVKWSPASDSLGIVLEIPRDLIVGLRGGPLVPGSLISEVYATGIGRTKNIEAPQTSVAGCNTWATGVTFCYAEVRDRFPNEGVLGPFEILTAPRHQGHLLYYSPEPQRGSNGEAATYIMELHVVNLAQAADEIAMASSDIPAGWAVELPGIVEVPAGATAVVPIVVSVPFFHIHGETRGFNVTGTSTLVPSISITQPFTVHWFTVAQPSGHHPKVFLHAGSDGAGWWNTLDSQPGADGSWITVEGYAERGTTDRNPTGGSFDGFLRIPHLPAFAMGLDARMEDVAPLVGTWQAGFAGQGTIEVAIMHEELAGELVTGRKTMFAGSTTMSFGVGENPLELSLAPSSDADFFALRPGYLWMEFVFRLDLPPESYAAHLSGNAILPQPAVFVGAGTRIDLPLDEYHDSLASSTQAADGLSLDVEASSLQMHPGNVQVLEATLSGGGSFEVVLGGPAAEWATAVPTEITGAQAFHVIVRVPADAEVGDSRGLVIKLVDTNDPLRQAARLVRIDITSEVQPDESELAASLSNPGKAAPALQPALVLAALFLALASRRR